MNNNIYKVTINNNKKYILGLRKTHNSDLSQDFPLITEDLANSLETPFKTSSTNSLATFFRSSAIVPVEKTLPYIFVKT